MYKTALITGALLAGLGVIIGAYGAHGLKEYLEQEQLQVFETGVRYQMYHSFAILLTGIIYGAFPNRLLKTAVACFITGIVLFSGSLYLMMLLKINGQVGLGGLGIITPIGGLFFVAGWLMLAVGVMQKTR